MASIEFIFKGSVSSGDELRLIFSSSHSILLSLTLLFRLPITTFGALFDIEIIENTIVKLVKKEINFTFGH